MLVAVAGIKPSCYDQETLLILNMCPYYGNLM